MLREGKSNGSIIGLDGQIPIFKLQLNNKQKYPNNTWGYVLGESVYPSLKYLIRNHPKCTLFTGELDHMELKSAQEAFEEPVLEFSPDPVYFLLAYGDHTNLFRVLAKGDHIEYIVAPIGTVKENFTDEMCFKDFSIANTQLRTLEKKITYYMLKLTKDEYKTASKEN